jgi:CBS domain-containing protein
MENFSARLLTILATLEPFRNLPEVVRTAITEEAEEIRFRQEIILYKQETSKVEGIDFILSGAYEAFFLDSENTRRHLEVCAAGSAFGAFSLLLNKKKSIYNVEVRKGTTVARLNRSSFKKLYKEFPEILQYYTTHYGQRMLNDEFAHFVQVHQATQPDFVHSDLQYQRSLDTVELRDLVVCPETATAQTAARAMSDKRVSCLFVQNESGDIWGYVTDILLRDLIVGQGVSNQTSLKSIASDYLITIDRKALVYEAILLMFRTKSRYLLVTEGGKPVGFLSRNKLLTEQAQSPFMFIQSVKLAMSDAELSRRWQQVPELVYQLLDRGVRAEIVNEVITATADIIALKVIEGVIEEMGSPPAAFAFIVLGSEGRKEQTLKTDQDNAIIYEDKANEQRELVRTYFLSMAEKVSARLDTIGFALCDGGFMASNPKWTHSLSHWKRNYTKWVQESDAEAVMKTSTFFDCRVLYGHSNLLSDLQEHIEIELKQPTGRFFYFLAQNALQYEPPLTFFNNFRTFVKGNKKVFNLKKAMTPVVDLVRVFALKHGIFKTNTGERMEALQEKGVFTQEEYRELLQSYYYLMALRLKHQAKQIIADGELPNNYLNPEVLTKVEQVTIKEIFKVISRFQLKIKMTITGSLY